MLMPRAVASLVLLLLPLVLLAQAPATTPPAMAPLAKGRPWSEKEILEALDRKENPNAIARAIREDKAEIYDRTLDRVNRRGVARDHPLLQELMMHARAGAGPWASDIATAEVAKRRQGVKQLPVPVDSPALRAKAQRGDPAAMWELRYALIQAQKDDTAFPDLAAKLSASGYAPAAAIEGEKYASVGGDPALADDAAAAAYFRKAAEAGDPVGAYQLANAFLYGKGVATNLMAAEFWLLESVARGWEGFYLGPLASGQLYKLYSYAQISADDEANARWAQELIRRGGALAENVQEILASDGAYERIIKIMQTLPPEPALWPAAERAKLEAAAQAGDVAALVKLGDAYAKGRGVAQDDVRAAAAYRRAAEKGHAPAARALSGLYAHGYGVKQDQAQRLAWLKKAGEAGSAVAWRELGDLYQWGDSNKKLSPTVGAARAVYEQAAAGGDAAALGRLANLYRSGRDGVTKDEAKGAELLQRAAEAGHGPSMADLATGLNQKKDFAGAVAWYRKAVAAGEVNYRASLAGALDRNGEKQEALALMRALVAESPGNYLRQIELGNMLRFQGDLAGALGPYRVVAADKSQNNSYREIAEGAIKEITAEQNPAPGSIPALTKQAEAGDAMAMLYLAEKLLPTDRPKAMEWVRKAADLGNAIAMRVLALQLVQTDKPAGLDWLQKAAAAGDADAKFRLGAVLLQGQDLPADPARALRLMNESADAGFVAGQYELGRTLIGGTPTVPANPTRGLALLKKAAGANLPAAAAVLGEVFERGMGVTADPIQALKWYQQARRLGVTQVDMAIARVKPLAAAAEQKAMQDMKR